MIIGILTAHFYELLMLFLIVFVHEMGHAFAAAYFKWRIKSITLLPFGGMLETEEHGNRPLKEDFFVLINGPIQHLWLFVLGYLFYMTGVVEQDLLTTFFYMNATICLFNLLPMWPLDGGKLLFLLLSLRYSFLRGYQLVLQFSFYFVIIFIFLMFGMGQFSLNGLIIIGFILFSLIVEWRQKQYVFMRFLLERHYGRNHQVMQLKPLTVDEQETVHATLQLFQKGSKHPIIIMKNGQERGVLDENELLHAYFTDKLTGIKVGDLLYSY